MPADDRLPLLNQATLDDLTFGEQDLQRELVVAFLDQAPGIAADLERLREPAQLREALHLLKGSCHVVAADRLLEVVTRAELAHAQPAPADARAALVVDVQGVLAQTLAQLEALLARLGGRPQA